MTAARQRTQLCIAQWRVDCIAQYKCEPCAARGSREKAGKERGGDLLPFPRSTLPFLPTSIHLPSLSRYLNISLGSFSSSFPSSLHPYNPALDQKSISHHGQRGVSPISLPHDALMAPTPLTRLATNRPLFPSPIQSHRLRGGA